MIRIRFRPGCRPGAVAAALLAGVLMGLGGSPAAFAQEAGGTGFTPDPGEPIEVVSDTAEWKRAENVAIFTGRVDAVQGTMRLRADQVFVHYLPQETGETAEAAPENPDAETPEGFEAEPEAGPGSSQRITQIDARGNVIITDVDDQTATGDWALYDVPGRRITMGDTVVLTQGENVIRGQRLVSNLDTGETQVEAGDAGAGGTQGGRVRSLFVTDGPAPDGDATTGETPAETAP